MSIFRLFNTAAIRHLGFMMRVFGHLLVQNLVSGQLKSGHSQSGHAIKTGLGLGLWTGYLLRLVICLGLMLGLELVFRLWLGSGPGLVMTVQLMIVRILTVPIKTGNRYFHSVVSSCIFRVDERTREVLI